MTQYINLLNPALRPRREPLTALSLAVTVCIVFVVLASGHLYLRLRAEARQVELKQLMSESKAEQDRLGAAEKIVTEARPDAQLAAEIEAARAVLKSRQSAMVVLESGALGDTEGFSEQFRAFARQATEGLWLTGFSLSGAGRDMLIQGRSVSAEKVPAYIRRLNGEQVFQGRSFAALQIEEGKTTEAGQPGAAAPYLEFQLVSSPERAARLGRGAEDVPALRGLGEGKP